MISLFTLFKLYDMILADTNNNNPSMHMSADRVCFLAGAVLQLRFAVPVRPQSSRIASPTVHASGQWRWARCWAWSSKTLDAFCFYTYILLSLIWLTHLLRVFSLSWVILTRISPRGKTLGRRCVCWCRTCGLKAMSCFSCWFWCVSGCWEWNVSSMCLCPSTTRT